MMRVKNLNRFINFFSRKSYQRISTYDESVEFLKHYKSILFSQPSRTEAQELLKSKEEKIISIFKKSGELSVIKKFSEYYAMNDKLKGISDFIKKNIANSENNYLQDLSGYYFSGQGKMFRPRLILILSKYINECLNPDNKEDFFKSKIYLETILPFASCIEVVHNASLLHDDIIDNSSMRRNIDTSHKVFGIRNTVFGANYLISKAAKVMSDKCPTELNEIFSSSIYYLIAGECQQTLEKPADFRKENIDLLFENYMKKTYFKTASLLAFTLRGIGIIFNLHEKIQRDLFNLGLHIGLVFQITDDLLDITDDSNLIKKPNFNDIKEGVVNSYLLFHIKNDKSGDLEKIIEGKCSKKDDIQKMIDILNKSTGILKAKCLSADHSYSALSILDNEFFVENQTKKVIYAILYQLINRKY